MITKHKFDAQERQPRSGESIFVGQVQRDNGRSTKQHCAAMQENIGGETI
jgi:hypothetical protein